MAVPTKGAGWRFHCSMKRLMASIRSRTLAKLPRRTALPVSSASQRSSAPASAFGRFASRGPRLLLGLLLGAAGLPFTATDAGAASLERGELLARLLALRRQVREVERELALVGGGGSTRLADAPVAAALPRFDSRLPESPTSSLGSPLAWQAARLASIAVPGAEVQPVLGTGSMRPVFGGESLLLMEPASFDELRVGDIVTYSEPRSGRLVVHRLVERYRDRFVARGDANRRDDPGYVTRENYRMRVFGVVYTRDAPELASRGP